MEKQVLKELNSVQMIDARAAKLSDYSYPITKNSNWKAITEYPRDRATITQQIGARRTNHERAFCYRYDYKRNHSGFFCCIDPETRSDIEAKFFLNQNRRRWLILNPRISEDPSLPGPQNVFTVFFANRLPVSCVSSSFGQNHDGT